MHANDRNTTERDNGRGEREAGGKRSRGAEGQTRREGGVWSGSEEEGADGMLLPFFG